MEAGVVRGRDDLLGISDQLKKDSSTALGTRNRAAASGIALLGAAGALGALGAVSSSMVPQFVGVYGGAVSGLFGSAAIGASVIAQTNGNAFRKLAKEISLNTDLPELRKVPIWRAKDYVGARVALDHNRAQRRGGAVLAVGSAAVAAGLAAGFGGLSMGAVTAVIALGVAIHAVYQAFVSAVDQTRVIRQNRENVERARSNAREAAQSRPAGVASVRQGANHKVSSHVPGKAGVWADGVHPTQAGQALGPGLGSAVPGYNGKRPKIAPPQGTTGQRNGRGV